MMTDIHTNNQNIWDTLLKLKKESNEVRKIALQRRISTQPYSTDFEYILGAFIEMLSTSLYTRNALITEEITPCCCVPCAFAAIA